MVAIIRGDVINSRKTDTEKWLIPLRQRLSTWGTQPKQWDLIWGDSFQLELTEPALSLRKALLIKSLLKQTPAEAPLKTLSTVDVRMAIGIGEKTYAGQSVFESNGPAFIYAGEKFDTLKKENVTLAVQTNHAALDAELNLYLKLAGTFMNEWSISSAALVELVLSQPQLTQREIGERLGIKQNSVSGRWERAHMNELLELEKTFQEKIKSILP